MDTYSVKYNGEEVARISGEGISCAKKLTDSFRGTLVDDPRLLRLVRGDKTVIVFYVSAADNVSIEKLGDA